MAVERLSPVPSVWRVGLFSLAFLVPSGLFVTGQSLWIDEAASCWFADHAQGFKANQFHGLAAVPEMPAFHLLLQVWVRVFGDSERALRSINLPFAAVFLFSLLIVCSLSQRRWWWLPALPFAAFPMLLFYVNECRPYTALLALSTAAAASLFVYLRSGSRWSIWICSFACLGSFSMHLLGILAPLTLLLWLAVMPQGRQVIATQWRGWSLPIVLTLPGYMALAFYYRQVHGEGITINQSPLPSQTPTSVATSWKNLLLFAYETCGFDGLGPPRNGLRIHPGIHTFNGYAIFLLAGSIAIAVLGIAFVLLWTEQKSTGMALQLLFCVAVALLALFAVARAAHFGFLGRHAMPLIGIAACAVVMGLSELHSHSRVRVVAAMALLCAWTLSSARLLFLYPYGKDDPRSALRIAAATGLPVLWNADVLEAAYYGGYEKDVTDPQLLLPPNRPTDHWQRRLPLTILQNSTDPTAVSTLTASLPDGDYVFVAGKPDLFDSAGLWADSIASWHPHRIDKFNGHDVWLIQKEGRARP